MPKLINYYSTVCIYMAGSMHVHHVSDHVCLHALDKCLWVRLKIIIKIWKSDYPIATLLSTQLFFNEKLPRLPRQPHT